MNEVTQNLKLGKKVLIIGCAGSGKTTLAKQLSKIIGLPIIHMDNYYWSDNWGRKSDAEWHDIVNELCQKPKWIMDGNYTKSMPIRFQYATAVIYLDVPRWKCLLRVVMRRFRLIYNKKRDDIPANCNERMNVEFYRWIWNYPKRSRNNTLELLKRFNGIVYHLKSKQDTDSFIKIMFSQSRPYLN